jgi:hypothetical protein
VLDSILAVGKFNLLIFNDQVGAEDATCHFSAVGAMADVATSLRPEEVVVIHLNLDSFTKVRSCFRKDVSEPDLPLQRHSPSILAALFVEQYAWIRYVGVIIHTFVKSFR